MSRNIVSATANTKTPLKSGILKAIL